MLIKPTLFVEPIISDRAFWRVFINDEKSYSRAYCLLVYQEITIVFKCLENMNFPNLRTLKSSEIYQIQGILLFSLISVPLNPVK